MSNQQQLDKPLKGHGGEEKKDGLAEKTKSAVRTVVDTMTEASHMRDTMKGPPGPEDD